MKKTQQAKLQNLNDWQVRQIDRACRTVATERKKSGHATNGAFRSFLYVFASALALVNAASLSAFQKAFFYVNKRALFGDDEAKQIFEELSLVVQDAASNCGQDDFKKEEVQDVCK